MHELPPEVVARFHELGIDPYDEPSLMSAEERADLDLVVRGELAAGNWPLCDRHDSRACLSYEGVIGGIPTFRCAGGDGEYWFGMTIGQVPT